MNHSSSLFAGYELIERDAQQHGDLCESLEWRNHTRALPFPDGRRRHTETSRKFSLRNTSSNARRAYIRAQ